METWTPSQYQAWWTALLAPYLPWVKVAVVALVVDALVSLAMLGIWLADRRR